MYVNGKMRNVETIPGMEGGRRKMERVNSTMIYCKNFYKCHHISQYNNNFKNLKRIKN
jgi:hypothetical protein